MQLIKMRERRQFTLPAHIAAAADLRIDDALAVSFVNGVIQLTPVGKAAKSPSVAHWLGAAKGVYGDTTEQMDAYVRGGREAW